MYHVNCFSSLDFLKYIHAHTLSPSLSLGFPAFIFLLFLFASSSPAGESAPYSGT